MRGFRSKASWGNFHGNSNEISSLVSLAAALREAPHPEPAREKMAAAKAKFLTAARKQSPAASPKKPVCLVFSPARVAGSLPWLASR